MERHTKYSLKKGKPDALSYNSIPFVKGSCIHSDINPNSNRKSEKHKEISHTKNVREALHFQKQSKSFQIKLHYYYIENTALKSRSFLVHSKKIFISLHSIFLI